MLYTLDHMPAILFLYNKTQNKELFYVTCTLIAIDLVKLWDILTVLSDVYEDILILYVCVNSYIISVFMT